MSKKKVPLVLNIMEKEESFNKNIVGVADKDVQHTN